METPGTNAGKTGVDDGPMIVQLPEHAESSRDLHTLLLDYISRVLKLLLIKYTHAWNLKNIELVIGNHNTLVLQTEILEMYMVLMFMVGTLRTCSGSFSPLALGIPIQQETSHEIKNIRS